jgi:sugar/nucleoside kinase (ribokinase family)
MTQPAMIHPATRDPDVIVVGEIYVDHILSGFATWPAPGEESYASSYAREVGGGAANTACGLARLGRGVELVGVIGVDERSWIESRIAQFGVRSALAQDTAPTGTTVSVSSEVDRAYFSYHGANAGLADFLASDDLLAWLVRARHVHFALPLSAGLAARILPVLGAAGCTTSLDAGYQPDWLRDPANAAMFAGISFLLPNAKEGELMTGSDDPCAYFAMAKARGFRSAVLKIGSRGVMADVAGRVITVAPPVTTARDTTGAGDAFNAGFIDALLDNAGLEQMLQRGCVCGALSTQQAGALAGLPDRPHLTSLQEQTYVS